MKLVIIDPIELETLLTNTVRKVLCESAHKAKEQEEFLSIEEACQLLHLAKPTIYTLTSSRRIPFIKTGKRILFRRTDLLRWLNEKRRKTVEELKE